MTKFLLKFSLNSFLERLKDEFDRQMGSVPIQKKRVWNEFVLFKFAQPTENTPEEQWHWVEYKDVPEELEKFSAIISDFEAFIENI